MAYEIPLTIFEVVQDVSANRYILPSKQLEKEYRPNSENVKLFGENGIFESRHRRHNGKREV